MKMSDTVVKQPSTTKTKKLDSDYLERPDCFDCGPYRWTITYSTQELASIRRVGGEDAWGITLIGDLRIIVEDDRPLQFIKDTVLHEIRHAFLYTHNIKIPHSMKEEDESEREEAFVTSESTMWLDAMQKNVELFTWLMTYEED